jgi:cold shock CspA family protein
MAKNERHTGEIIFYREKGWGFLKDDSTGTDLFYHISDLLNNIVPSAGLKVSFIVGTNKNRPIAREISKIE